MARAELEKLIDKLIAYYKLVDNYIECYKDKDPFTLARDAMVKEQLISRDIVNPTVIGAMLKVPRHEFVPEELVHYSYEDFPFEIGYCQTISQPYIVALMTQWLEPSKEDRVLEIGTGSGYQAAVLAEIVKEVYTVEIIAPLANEATERLRRYQNVHLKQGDLDAWLEYAPFDKIIATASPISIPNILVQQLKENGLMTIPIGKVYIGQELKLLKKENEHLIELNTLAVHFVPMTGNKTESSS